MMKKTQMPRPSAGQLIRQTVLLVLVALVSITAATFAWFSIADRTRVKSMGLEITTGASLRFDLVPHDTFLEYVKTLSFQQICEKIRAELGYDPLEKDLTPVTSPNGISFATEEGESVLPEKGDYLEFELHFMATQDMDVHLTSNDGEDPEDRGTSVESENGAASAMRISFTADDHTAIYQPQGTSSGTFTLAPAGQMRYDESNTLFSLLANVDKPVMVRIWLEGEDAACTDEIRQSEYSIRMRFQGTDENGEIIS